MKPEQIDLNNEDFMKITPGKYKMRNGEIAEVTIGVGSATYPVRADLDIGPIYCREDGTCCVGVNGYDLIERIEESEPIKKDKPHSPD